ncbi:MAG: CPBP family intramembrane glutamic endopeptidase [Bacillota bacterium]
MARNISADYGVKKGKGFIRLLIFISWVAWLPGVISNQTLMDNMVLGSYLAGSIAPLLAAVIFIFFNYTSQDRRSFKKRLLSPRYFPAKWYLIIFILPFLVQLLAWGAADFAGWSNETLISLSFKEDFNSLGLIYFLIIIVPAIYQEIAWRGIAQSELQKAWSALKTALVIGMAWIIWQLPLFFIGGTAQASLEVSSLSFWLHHYDIIIMALVFTWIYNKTGQSVFAVIIFNAVYYFSQELFQMSIQADILSKILYTFLVMFLIYRQALEINKTKTSY